MAHLLQLWLPILVAAIGVFVASSLIHMVFKWHDSDYRARPNEAEVAAAIRAGAPTPGQYVIPYCPGMKAMGDPANQARFREGPVGLVVLRPNGLPKMGGTLALWFVFALVIAAAAAAIALQVYGLGGDGHAAAHLAALVTLFAYGGGSVPQGIWMGRPWAAVAKDLLDSLVYAVATAFAFAWLWPHAG
jgi:hypothetical protein